MIKRKGQKREESFNLSDEHFSYIIENDKTNSNNFKMIITEGKHKGEELRFYEISPSLAYFYYWKENL